MMGPSRHRLAICFFGITRSLRYTFPALQANILDPARRQFRSVSVYAHLYDQDRIHNPRSGEAGALDTEEYKLLNADWLCQEKPDGIAQAAGLDQLKSYGDSWEDGFNSLHNLLLQLHSLKSVTNAVLQDGIDYCLYCRPDLMYHDRWNRALYRLRLGQQPHVMVPRWQAWEGLNDRFALVRGRNAISAYGHRLDLADMFCTDGPQPLHSERLLAYALERAGIGVSTVGLRASRVRSGGEKKVEDFGPSQGQLLLKRASTARQRVRGWMGFPSSRQ